MASASTSTSNNHANDETKPFQPQFRFDSFIGCFMHVITLAKFRYEGFCFHLNLQKEELGLTNVKIFRTESRGEDNVEEIRQVGIGYSTVLLRASHIMEVQIISPQDIPSTSTIPDHHFTTESDNIPPPTSSTVVSQLTDVISDILSRLEALLQGIWMNKSESLWSQEFWAVVSPSFTPGPALRELDVLCPQTNFPEFRKSAGVISRPLETVESPERQKSREQQQQPPQRLSENEKGKSVDSEEARTKMMSSEASTDARRPSVRGSQVPRRVTGGEGTSHGGRSRAVRGRGKAYWAPRGR